MLMNVGKYAMHNVMWDAGMGVTLLEYRTLGSGMTGRTTAHIMTWNDDYYSVLQSEFGKDKTKVIICCYTPSVQAQTKGIGQSVS